MEKNVLLHPVDLEVFTEHNENDLGRDHLGCLS